MKRILLFLASLSLIACSQCDTTCNPKPLTVDEQLVKLQSEVEALQSEVEAVRKDTGFITLPGAGIDYTYKTNGIGQVTGLVVSSQTVPLADILKQIMAHDGLTLRKTPAVESSVDVVPAAVKPDTVTMDCRFAELAPHAGHAAGSTNPCASHAGKGAVR
jgi:hypothetical protein